MKSLNILICFLIISACSGNTTENENCNFLLNINVNEVVNLSLPQYSQLQFAGNSVYIDNAGNGGVIIASTGADYYAWDAADPNRIPVDCSILTPSGLEATSSCDDKNTYSLITGQALNDTDGSLQCSLRNYRVEQSGNTLIISF